MFNGGLKNLEQIKLATTKVKTSLRQTTSSFRNTLFGLKYKKFI